jgi:hypothetical protein
MRLVLVLGVSGSGRRTAAGELVKKLIAVLVAALPTLLLAQTVTVDCPEESCQIALYFAGTGGFVGTSAGLGGQTDVPFFVICGAVTISATAAPDGDGVVRQPLTEGSGMYCGPGTRGRLETTFEVNCPSGQAASTGAELVPENPFPVDE